MTTIIDHYAVMGNPIVHSLSPKIHMMFAEQTGEAMDYVAIEVPLDNFVAEVKYFASKNGKGLNITLPFKTQAYEFVTQASPRAIQSKTVNTIVFKKDGSSYGDNTDGIGLVRDLEKNLNLNLKESRLLLFGTGGAIRGILPSLIATHPKSICVCGRDIDSVALLAEEFSNEIIISGCSYDNLEGYFDIIINGTSASIYNQALPLPAKFSANKAVCYDLAYNIKDNLFLTWAKQNGASAAVDGLGMLVEQAAEAFYLWRGIHPNTRKVLDALSLL